MPHLYALVTANGIERLEVSKKLEGAELTNKVGIPGEECNIDFISEQFSDEAIDIICDDEFLCKEFPIICITPGEMRIGGQIVIAACTPAGATIGLTEKQFELVKKELTLVKDKGKVLQIYHQTNIPTHIPTENSNTTAENN